MKNIKFLNKKNPYKLLALSVMTICGTASADILNYDKDSYINENIFIGYNKNIDDIINFTNKNIYIENKDQDSLTAFAYGKMNVGNPDTENVTVKYTGKSGYSVLYANSKVIDGNNVISIEDKKNNLIYITAKNSINILSSSMGIWTQSNTEENTAHTDGSGAILKAQNINIQTDETSICAFLNSYINIQAENLNISAGDNILLQTRGYSNVNITSTKSASLIGDIAFVTTSTNSGNYIDSFVNISLNGNNSSWTGSTLKVYPHSLDEKFTNINNFSLALSNGAQWNVQSFSGPNAGGGDLDSDNEAFVNKLALSNGVININDISLSSLIVDELEGSGGYINLAANVEDGAITDTAKIDIKSIAQDPTPTLNIAFKGVTADDIKDSKEALAKFDDAVAISSSNNGVIQVRTIAEGDINGAITQIVDADGNKSAVSHASNSKIESYSSMLSLATAQWRHELNSLSKRLGEVRSAPKSVGLWARAYGSEMEYGPQDVTLENNTIQIGFDTDLGAGFKVGSAISYTDGSTSALNGSADNDLYGFALYGTYLADNGIYADLIGKYSRISNDFRFQNFSGSYDNNAYSLSLETGWNFKLNNTIFIEPQAEFTYGKILGDDFTAGNGVTINQEDTDTTIIRGGLRAGFNLPEDKGLIYAKASIVHDFDSESAFNASQYNAASDRVNSVYVEDDLGGTWAEYGIGANINWTDNCYTYIEIERTSGSDLTENYRWNLGMRYSF